MSIKKILLLASMALAAIAFAAPAAAQAEWLHNHERLENNANIHMEGRAGFEGLGSGVECAVTANLLAEPGSTGLVTNFTIDNTDCVYEGIFEGCELVDSESTTPWVAHANTTANNVTITEAVIHNEFDHECPVKTAELTFHATAVPDNALTMSTVTLEGTGEVHLFDTDGAPIGSLPSDADGLLHLTEPETYGIA